MSNVTTDENGGGDRAPNLHAAAVLSTSTAPLSVDDSSAISDVMRGKSCRSSSGSSSVSSVSSALSQNYDTQPASKKAKVSLQEKLIAAFEETRDDAETSFCLSLVEQLKQLSPRQQAIVKLQIQQILFDAEFSSREPLTPRNMNNVGMITLQTGSNFSMPPPPPPPMQSVAQPVHTHMAQASQGASSTQQNEVHGQDGFQNQPLYEIMEFHRNNADQCQGQ